MLKYLIALANELDRCGEKKAADTVDKLIIYAAIEVDDWKDYGEGNWVFNYKNYAITISETLGSPPHKYLGQVTPITGWRDDSGKRVPVIPGVLEADRFYLTAEDDLEDAKQKAILLVNTLPTNSPPDVWTEDGNEIDPYVSDVFLKSWENADKKSNAKDSKVKMANKDIPFHETVKSTETYHDWLKQPENWSNPELVKYLVKNGEDITEIIYGLSWRNCKLCDSTITKKTDKPLFIDKY